MSDLSGLVAALQPPETSTLKRRKATVTAVVVGPPPSVTITLAGTTIAGVRYVNWYRPTVNDVVEIAVDGQGLICLGTLAGVAISPIDVDTVVTSETTASGSFVDLATVGPALSRQTDTLALVTISAGLSDQCRMSFAISGATTAAATNARSLRISGVSLSFLQASRVVLVSGLTPGLNTFTAKYMSISGTATFSDRSIIVEPK